MVVQYGIPVQEQLKPAGAKPTSHDKQVQSFD